MRRLSSASTISKPGREPVKRAEPGRGHLFAERGLDAPAHLPGGFIGEGNSEDTPRRNASYRDPVRHHTR
jgi:hypothetical protein